jgi:hypothetical protein
MDANDDANARNATKPLCNAITNGLIKHGSWINEIQPYATYATKSNGII